MIKLQKTTSKISRITSKRSPTSMKGLKNDSERVLLERKMMRTLRKV